MEAYKPYAWTLEETITKRFFVPVYQRPYSWEDKEVKSLLDDIYVAFNEGAYGAEPAFMGTLFLRDNGKDGSGNFDCYEVVDGQQRLTTFSMILLSYYSICCERGMAERPDVGEIKGRLWKYSYSDSKYMPQWRLITLGSIERVFFEKIFDAGFNSPKKLKKFVTDYLPSNPKEKNIRDQFLNIYDWINNAFPNGKVGNFQLAKFGEFLRLRIQFICIAAYVPMPKVFSVFESINSKGRRLDNVDLMKTYIFSELLEEDYDTYLSRWGKLIEITDDEVEDFIETYIRAYLNYYHQAINLNRFKALVNSENFRAFYKKDNTRDALKAFLDDLLEKAETFSLFSNPEAAEKLINRDEFKLYYKIFQINRYNHPKPLIFRTFQEFKDGLLTKEGVCQIVRSATMFSFLFLSLYGGKSGDCIVPCEEPCKEAYANGRLSPNGVEKSFKKWLGIRGITKDVLVSKLLTTDIYTKHDLTYTVLCLYESVDPAKNKLLFDQACFMLDHIRDQYFHEDHLLPQNPPFDSKEFKYRKVHDFDGREILVLDNDHDFPTEAVKGMDYKEFQDRILSVVGNIRLYLKSSNIERGNEITRLPDHEDFTSYSQVRTRSENIAQTLFGCPDILR